jgi:hypothetical protein
MALLASSCAQGTATPIKDSQLQVAAASRFDYADLEALIANNNVSTIDQLLPLLPLDYRANYTFIYSSRGQHAANVFPDQPRVLLYGTDGTFMMVFGKNPSAPPVVDDADSLQTIEWQPDSRSFILRELDFSPGKKPLDPEPIDNPASCLSCHGNDPRPIFDVYNFWPGFYGSVGRQNCDTMRAGTPEMAGYTAFLAQHRHADRYQFLPPEADFAGCPSDPNDELTVRNGNADFPNEDLTDKIFVLNEQRIRRIFESVPGFTAYNPLLTALGGDCLEVLAPATTDFGATLETFFPPGFAQIHAFDSFAVTEQNMLAQSRVDFGKRLARFNVNNRASKDDPDRLPINFNDDQDAEGAPFGQFFSGTLIKLMADRMGVDVTTLSPNFRDGTFEFGSAIHNAEEILSFGVAPVPFGRDVCETLRRQSRSSF